MLIDGQDVRDVQLESLRRSIGVVPQDTVLFNSTLGDNLRYGNPDATWEQVEQAARDSQVLESIQRMPQGFETIVGERGLKISGGEKQRIAIARAMLKDAPVLFCDEATSSLDSQTERGLLKSLSNFAHDRTSLFVAHRLATVADADKIVVLKDGVVAEQGTHDALLDQDGIYSGMWRGQQGGMPDIEA